MAILLDPKDPGDTCDRTIGFSGLLHDQADINSVTSVAITPVTDPALTESAADRVVTSPTVTLWFAAGKADTTYDIAITISADSGRVYKRTVRLPVQEL